MISSGGENRRRRKEVFGRGGGKETSRLGEGEKILSPSRVPLYLWGSKKTSLKFFEHAYELGKRNALPIRGKRGALWGRSRFESGKSGVERGNQDKVRDGGWGVEAEESGGDGNWREEERGGGE